MGRKEQKRKTKEQRKKKFEKKREKIKTMDETGSKSTLELLTTSEDIVRLKVSVRKGARIESVPLKKLERLATRRNLLWNYGDGWLILYGHS